MVAWVRWSLLAASAVAALLGGCYGPPPALRADDPPQLVAIQDAFSSAVRRARAADDASWRSGWHGNMMVNVVGGPNRGLCWQWQQMVYEGDVETDGRLGWDATGVALNAGTDNEHHAVLDWDPKRVERPNLLTELRQNPELVESATEEILRWGSVTMHFRRTATEDYELNGNPRGPLFQSNLWSRAQRTNSCSNWSKDSMTNSVSWKCQMS